MAIGLGAIAVLAVIGFLAERDGFPDSLDGLTRIRTSEAEAFEDSLDEFAFGDVHLTGAMYGGADDVPVLIVERIEGPDEQVALIPVQQTFDGVVFGFENSGAGDIDEATLVKETTSGLEVACAELQVDTSPYFPEGTGTVCVWKGRTLGTIFDLRTADASAAVATARPVAAALDEG